MAMIRGRSVIASAVLVLLMSCDETFSPVERFQPAVVIYSVLDPARDTQYVRLASSYDPPDHIPANQQTDSAVAGAVVQIIDSLGTITLQPTFLPRWSNDRYTDPIPAFVAPGFRPGRGASYRLLVQSSLGTAEAIASVPGTSFILTPDDPVLLAPQLYSPAREISFRCVLSPVTYAFFIRWFVDYEVAIPGGWDARTIEMPRTLLRDDSISTYLGTYPHLRRRTSSLESSAAHTEVFYAGPYLRMIRLLRQSVPFAGSIRFLRARVIVYQADEAFYRYVKTVNGFSDQFSIRTDEPDVSNIVNGRGLFSSVATDTLNIPLPSSLGL